MYTLFLLSVMAFGAFTCMAIAEAKHRSRGSWFLVGALFPLPAILIAWSLPALPAPRMHL